MGPQVAHVQDAVALLPDRIAVDLKRQIAAYALDGLAFDGSFHYYVEHQRGIALVAHHLQAQVPLQLLLDGFV
jgi:hypothetical protein